MEATTLSQRLNLLKEQGYDVDFNLDENCIVCVGSNLTIDPEDLNVDKFYRFEGESDPSDAAIIYALSSEKHNLKGVLVNGYGIYTDPKTDAILKVLDAKTAKNTPPID